MKKTTTFFEGIHKACEDVSLTNNNEVTSSRVGEATETVFKSLQEVKSNMKQAEAMMYKLNRVDEANLQQGFSDIGIAEVKVINTSKVEEASIEVFNEAQEFVSPLIIDEVNLKKSSSVVNASDDMQKVFDEGKVKISMKDNNVSDEECKCPQEAISHIKKVELKEGRPSKVEEASKNVYIDLQDVISSSSKNNIKAEKKSEKVKKGFLKVFCFS